MLEIQTIKGRSLVSLRVTRGRVEEAVSRLGLAPPLTKRNADTSSVWMSPDHWLMMSDTQDAEEIIEYCNGRLTDMTHNATNVTDALLILQLSGVSVRELLSSGSGLDFRAAYFSEGTCQRTRFAQIQATICACDSDQFELIFDQTYGGYLRSWIADSNTILQAVLLRMQE